MIASVTRLNGRAVGSGSIGPTARSLYATLVDDIRRECSARANYTSGV